MILGRVHTVSSYTTLQYLSWCSHSSCFCLSSNWVIFLQSLAIQGGWVAWREASISSSLLKYFLFCLLLLVFNLFVFLMHSTVHQSSWRCSAKLFENLSKMCLLCLQSSTCSWIPSSAQKLISWNTSTSVQFTATIVGWVAQWTAKLFAHMIWHIANTLN